MEYRSIIIGVVLFIIGILITVVVQFLQATKQRKIATIIIGALLSTAAPLVVGIAGNYFYDGFNSVESSEISSTPTFQETTRPTDSPLISQSTPPVQLPTQATTPISTLSPPTTPPTTKPASTADIASIPPAPVAFSSAAPATTETEAPATTPPATDGATASEPSTPEPSTPEPSTPEPSTPEPSTPEFSLAPVDDYPTNFWEGDYVIGTLIAVYNSDPIQCILDSTVYTFSNDVGSFSIGHENINAINLLNLIGSECRFNLDTAGYVVDVEVEFDFEGILTRIDYDKDGNICAIQIDYDDNSGGMVTDIPADLSIQLEDYLNIGDSYSVHFDIMGNVSSVIPT